MRLAIIIMLFIHASMQAQTPLRWYGHGGVNYTHLNDPLGTEHGPYAGRGADGFGGTIGISLERALTQGWSAVVEGSAVLRRSGYRFDEGQKYYPADLLVDGLDRGYRSTNSTYGQGACLLAFRGFPGLRLEAGVYAAWLARAYDQRKGERWFDGSTEALNERTNVTSDLAPWDLGWALGTVVEGPQRIHAQLRYVSSLVYMNRAAGTSPSMATGVQLCVVYALNAPEP